MTAVGPLACALLVLALGGLTRLALAAGPRGGVVRRLDRGGGAEGAQTVESLLRRLGGRPPRWLAPALADAGVDLEPAVAWSLWWIAGGLSLAVVLVVGGPLPTALVVGAVALGPVLALRARRGRGAARLEAALPAALEAMARSLRSGASVRQAVGEAAAATPEPLAGELRLVSAQAARGAPLVAALEELARRQPRPGVRLAVAALCLGIETGGAQARAVDGVAATLRDRLAVAAEVRALSAQARLSAVIIGIAPLGFGAFAAATDPRTSTFLFHTVPGLLLLTLGLALDGLGWLWMRRLSRVVV
ncbi:MAG TPA: type II secretion system F family protein [Acidimicrobiales bacterium]|nr:type II secretion system F family protein [Acidimicrobiales bacterium]